MGLNGYPSVILSDPKFIQWASRGKNLLSLSEKWPGLTMQTLLAEIYRPCKGKVRMDSFTDQQSLLPTALTLVAVIIEHARLSTWTRPKSGHPIRSRVIHFSCKAAIKLSSVISYANLQAPKSIVHPPASSLDVPLVALPCDQL